MSYGFRFPLVLACTCLALAACDGGGNKAPAAASPPPAPPAPVLGSSSAAIVEFMIPEPGNYVMVDHHFANASQGAVGVIAAGGTGDAEHHNIPATAAPTDPQAVRGKLAFESKCLACHTIAGGDKLGPDLFDVTRRHDEAWLARWLKDPEGMVKTDATAKAMLDKYKIPMPNQGLSDADVREFIAYFRWVDANVRPQGSTQPQPAAPGTALPPDKTLSGAPPGGTTSHEHQSATDVGAGYAAPAGKGK